MAHFLFTLLVALVTVSAARTHLPSGDPSWPTVDCNKLPSVPASAWQQLEAKLKRSAGALHMPGTAGYTKGVYQYQTMFDTKRPLAVVPPAP